MEKREVSGKPKAESFGINPTSTTHTVYATSSASIRENKGPSFGKIQVKIQHQRSPYAMKFEDRSHEETERQERCARGDAWRLSNNIYKLQKKQTTFYSLAEEWIMLAASTIKPEDREFEVDSGASMHMVIKRDFNSAESETMRISKNPTTVMTANGEVQTREEAMVYVQELDLFVTVMLLEETPAVLSAREALRGSRAHLPTGPAVKKPHLTKNGKRNDCKKSNHVPFVVAGLSRSSSSTTHSSALVTIFITESTSANSDLTCGRCTSWLPPAGHMRLNGSMTRSTASIC